MLRLFIRPLRALVQTLAEPESSRQLAIGFALGMMLGLVPKGNLTAAVLGGLILAFRVNLTAAALATAIFSWVGVWTDPLAHGVGSAVLTWSPVQRMGAWLYEKPLFPWTALNNTVVFGSLVLGVALFYPAYHLSFMVWERVRPRLADRIARYHAAKLLAGTDAATSWRLR